MKLNENKSFHASSKKMLNCALYAYASKCTREGIINDIFNHIQNTDFEILSKQALYPVTAKIYVSSEEFKEVSGIIKKGCRNYNISYKYIVETCIILAIKGLHKDGSLSISRNDIDNMSNNDIQVNIQQPYIRMLRCKIEPKYDKLPPSNLVTMAVKYVLKNKYECIRVLQQHINMDDSDNDFLKELHIKNRDVLREFDSTICKLIKFHYKEKNTKYTSLGVFNWIVDEFIIKYYKLDRNVFTIGKIIEKEPEPIPEKKNDDKVMTESTIQKDDQLNCKNRVYPNNRIYDNNDLTEEDYEHINTEIKDIMGSNYFKSDSSHPVNTNSSDVADDDDSIMVKILKLRSQLKHTKLELIIKDKE